MLVLSRRVNESIQIGTDIEIMVIDVRGDVVRLGISAPQSTQIWRKELWDIIVKENLRPCPVNHQGGYSLEEPEYPPALHDSTGQQATLYPENFFVNLTSQIIPAPS